MPVVGFCAGAEQVGSVLAGRRGVDGQDRRQVVGRVGAQAGGRGLAGPIARRCPGPLLAETRRREESIVELGAEPEPLVDRPPER